MGNMFDTMITSKRFKLKKSQLIKADLDKVWEFFTTTENIFKLTPPKMQMAPITHIDKDSKIYQGQIIDYWVTPLLKIPVKWQTEIIDICPNEEFTDVQNTGPFGYWKHRHIFTQTSVGILVEDEVDYEMPIPVIGSLLDNFIVRQNLDELFDFRKQQLDKIFNIQ